MIFVTVGSQLPFDRLIKVIDNWAAENKDLTVYAQIGMADYIPKHFDFCQSMTPEVYQAHLEKSDLIISHVGLGTIISALESGKPLLLMPRLNDGIECRNAHQFATAKHFAHYSNITIASDEGELSRMLMSLPKEMPTHASTKIETAASPALIKAISDFVNNL